MGKNGETLDTRPGDYYVTIIYGNRFAYIAGPFRNDHQAALGMVDKARRVGCDLDARGHWYAWGTARLEIDDTKIRPAGRLNKELGLPA